VAELVTKGIPAVRPLYEDVRAARLIPLGHGDSSIVATSNLSQVSASGVPAFKECVSTAAPLTLWLTRPLR
jgi:hypothetical protein